MLAKKQSGSRRLTPFNNSFTPTPATFLSSKYHTFEWPMHLGFNFPIPQARKLLTVSISSILEMGGGSGSIGNGKKLFGKRVEKSADWNPAL